MVDINCTIFILVLSYSGEFVLQRPTEPVFLTSRELGMDSEALIPPAYVAWPAGTTNSAVVPVRNAGKKSIPRLLKRFSNTG
jgi:hypothetical protein